MNQERSKEKNGYRDIEFYREEKRRKLLCLNDYQKDYSIEKFMNDLMCYFDGEVDFNLEKIKEIVGQPGKLEQLIQRATHKETHPVTEFVKDILRESTL
jgi:hypothetical protein